MAFVTDVYSRRIIGWQTSTSLYTDLALHALEMAVWQRKRQGADLSGLVHHFNRGVQFRAIHYGQALSECDAATSVGSKGDSFLHCPDQGTQHAVQGQAHPQPGTLAGHRRRRPRHRRVGPLGGHHSPSLRYRYAYPRRPRSRLGPQYQPEQLGTITIGNHPHQIYQPPQNPGLDTHQGVTSQVRRQEQDHAHSGWPCPGPSGEHQQGNGFTKCT